MCVYVYLYIFLLDATVDLRIPSGISTVTPDTSMCPPLGPIFILTHIPSLYTTGSPISHAFPSKINETEAPVHLSSVTMLERTLSHGSLALRICPMDITSYVYFFTIKLCCKHVELNLIFLNICLLLDQNGTQSLSILIRGKMLIGNKIYCCPIKTGICPGLLTVSFKMTFELMFHLVRY